MSNEQSRIRYALASAVGAASMALLVLAIVLASGVHLGSRDTINQAGRPTAEALAETVAELDAAPRIKPAEIEAIVERLRARAREGDLEAARFIAELARLQARDARTAPDEATIEPADASTR